MTPSRRQQIFDTLMSGLDPEEHPELACMVADDVTRLEPIIEDMISDELARWMLRATSEAA